MTNPLLQVIIGSTRPGRVGDSIGEWFAAVARADDRFEIELIDLAEVDLPLLDEPHHPRREEYVHEHTKRWSATIRRADAYVFVIPEYNASMNSATKNAIDFLYNEWARKPLGIVSYGGVSAGLKAAQALKQVATTLKMVPTPDILMIPMIGSLRDDEGRFTPTPIIEDSATALLDELTVLTGALAPLRGVAANV